MILARRLHDLTPPVVDAPRVDLVDLVAQNAGLRARVAELEALLATATAPAPVEPPAKRRA